jgi:hypothetical protein
MDPFRGTTKEWLDEILSLAWASGSSSSEFHDATMHRLRRVRAEVQTIRPESRDMENKIRAFERSFLYVEGLYK